MSWQRASTLLVPPLLFPIVGSALDEVSDFLLEDIAYLLQKTLPVMEYVVLVLYECEPKHKEYTWRATKSLLPLLRAQ